MSITVASCSINSGSVIIKLGTISNNYPKITVTIAKFNNPTTACDVTYLETQLLNSVGTTTTSYSTTSITGFTGATMTTAALSSSSAVVGASG